MQRNVESTVVYVKLWLDDERPSPEGWKHCKTVSEAIRLLTESQVDEMSLDHDLGLCMDCFECASGRGQCSTFGTGYDLVKWMAENNIWPASKPKVHSQNIAGATAMRALIDRYGPYERI